MKIRGESNWSTYFRSEKERRERKTKREMREMAGRVVEMMVREGGG